jgi:hypothetical protein
MNWFAELHTHPWVSQARTNQSALLLLFRLHAQDRTPPSSQTKTATLGSGISCGEN